MNYSYLKDKDFVKEIDNLTIKTLNVKVTILSWNEQPLFDFTGKTLPGATLNLDGNSSLRRTGNISILLDDDDIDILKVENLISINKKIRLEIGIDNTTTKYKEYDEIWFPLGIYVIIQPNIVRNASGTTLSLQLKDKMCLLNGEVSGTLPASITFNERSYFNDDEEEVIENPTIFQIILELVNHWGGEQLGNIIIEDIDEKIKKVMKWNNSNYPIYMKINENNSSYNYEYKTILQPEDNVEEWIARSFGEDIGFVYTDFTWPEEDLIGDAGNSVCDILDKICELMGNYEYFYDIYGKFHFREKRNYLNTTQTTKFLQQLKEQEGTKYLSNISKNNYKIDLTQGKAEYLLNDNFLVNSYTNVPQYNMIKNDFIIWGMRKNVDDTTLPIRYHLAIDKKPELQGHFVILCKNKENGLKTAAQLNYIKLGYDINSLMIGKYYCLFEEASVIGVDNLHNKIDIYGRSDSNPALGLFKNYITYNKLERNILSQVPYYNNTVLADENRNTNNNPNAIPVFIDDNNIVQPVYANFTLEQNIIYFDNVVHKCVYETENGQKVKVLKQCDPEDAVLVYINSQDWRTELYLQGVEADTLATDSNYYYTELVNEWPKIYDIEKGEFLESVINDPTSMDYFLDFIDTDTPLGEFCIDNIGRRTKAEVDDKVNCIFSIDPLDCILTMDYTEIPDIVERGQRYSLVNNDVYDNLVQGGVQNSAFGRIREMLYQYTSYCENITLQTIPIYHLDTNTRITVEDPKSGIFGDYIINRITLPLDCSGMMTINATRAIERI